MRCAVLDSRRAGSLPRGNRAPEEGASAGEGTGATTGPYSTCPCRTGVLLGKCGRHSLPEPTSGTAPTHLAPPPQLIQFFSKEAQCPLALDFCKGSLALAQVHLVPGLLPSRRAAPLAEFRECPDPPVATETMNYCPPVSSQPAPLGAAGSGHQVTHVTARALESP